jgi:uncharacterized protein YkwD
VIRRLLFATAVLLLPAAASAQSLAEQVLELVNDARWDNGQLPPLKGHAQLDTAATGHSTNMAVRDFFMHCDPDTGKGHGTRMTDAGYAWNSAGENIGAGYSSAAAAMNGWMASSGHRANILSASYHEIGVGYFFESSDSAPKRTASMGGCTPDGSSTGNFRHYWTQNFGRRSGNYPLVIAREAFQTSTCNIDLYVYGSGFATQMRFSNDGTNWSAWQAYAADVTWPLSGNAGATATVRAQIRNGAGTVREASDSIRLAASCGAGGVDPNLVFEHGFEG